MLAGCRRRPARRGLLAAAMILAAGGLPLDSDATGCATAAPPEAVRFRPLTDNPHLWDQPAIRAVQKAGVLIGQRSLRERRWSAVPGQSGYALGLHLALLLVPHRFPSPIPCF